MYLGLRGRLALIAASTSGLGLAAATALASEGVHVGICGRNPERLASAFERLSSHGVTVLADRVDLTNIDAACNWVDDVADQFGGLDIVVTNSGGVSFGPLPQFSPSLIMQAVHDNLTPHVALALAALPHLRASGNGRLLMIASESIREPHESSGLSSVARLGVLGLMKGLVDDLGRHHATVNVLAPGYHRTAALEKQFGNQIESRIAEIASRLPAGQIGNPADFGAFVAFLASDYARFITGTVNSVDGGNTRGIH